MKAGTQFIGIKPNVDMTERRSNVANNSTEVFTIEDIAETVLPKPAYAVYTALLTQSGIDTPESQTKGAVKAGVSYVISSPLRPEDSWDFSNVGGPIYPDDYSFVATSDDVPNDYGVAILNYNTGAPVVTVLENTLGNIWFTYNDVGVYSVNSNELFTLNKVAGFITFNNGGNNGLGDKPNFAISPSESNTVYIDSVSDGVKSNDILFNTPIEIRVYN